MTSFTVENLRQIYCLTFEQFLKALCFPDNSYGKEKFYLAQRDLGKFLCNLDINHQAYLKDYLDNK